MANNDPLSALVTFELPPKSESTGNFINDPEEPEELEPPEPHINEPASDQHISDVSRWNKYRGTKAKSGEEFDPSEHHCPPSETKTGKWRKKSKKQRSEWGLDKDSETAPLVESNTQSRFAAQKIAGTYASLHAMIYGADGAKIIDSELMPLVQAWERKINEGGVPELSALQDVILNSALYTGMVANRKINKPVNDKIKEKIIYPAWEKIKSLFTRKKLVSDNVVHIKDKKEPEPQPESPGEVGSADGFESFYNKDND